MAFFVTSISGLWGLRVKLVQILIMPCTGRKIILHYLPGDSALVHGLSQEYNWEVLNAGGSNTENNRPCD